MGKFNNKPLTIKTYDIKETVFRHRITNIFTEIFRLKLKPEPVLFQSGKTLSQRAINNTKFKKKKTVLKRIEREIINQKALFKKNNSKTTGHILIKH